MAMVLVHAAESSGLAVALVLILLCVSRPGTLHDFRSHEIADQLTLLDAELFYKIEVRGRPPC